MWRQARQYRLVRKTGAIGSNTHIELICRNKTMQAAGTVEQVWRLGIPISNKCLETGMPLATGTIPEVRISRYYGLLPC